MSQAVIAHHVFGRTRLGVPRETDTFRLAHRIA